MIWSGVVSRSFFGVGTGTDVQFYIGYQKGRLRIAIGLE